MALGCVIFFFISINNKNDSYTIQAVLSIFLRSYRRVGWTMNCLTGVTCVRQVGKAACAGPAGKSQGGKASTSDSCFPQNCNPDPQRFFFASSSIEPPFSNSPIAIPLIPILLFFFRFFFT